MKTIVFAVAASFLLCSASFAAPKHPAKPNHQTVNTNVNHHIKTRPVPPHHTVHLTPQQRHDSAARMMQPIR